MDKFIFDVDGTLTPSRQSITDEFKEFFLEFCRSHDVYLVTGSDYEKTLEQLGKEICENVKRVYNCSGSDVWENGVNVRTEKWVLPEAPHNWLSERLTESDFPVRAGLHFEHRPGMVNFSVVGRNADFTQRAHYVKWDKERDERKNIAEIFVDLFPELDARVGGETSIDIFPKGKDKSQIIKDFESKDELHFFGDAMGSSGNDFPLAKAIVDNHRGTCYNVCDYKATWNMLKQLCKNE